MLNSRRLISVITRGGRILHPRRNIGRLTTVAVLRTVESRHGKYGEEVHILTVRGRPYIFFSSHGLSFILCSEAAQSYAMFVV